MTLCGCCGREWTGDWCDKCRPHIPKAFGAPPWDRTYFAQHGRDCPFQIRENEKHSRASSPEEQQK